MENLGRIAANIDLANLSHNFHTLKACLPRGCEGLAVVKADAYGHGAAMVARRLEKEGAAYFAVATPEEAFELRDNGITAPILVLGYSTPHLAVRLAKGKITQSVFSLDYADALASNLGDEALLIHIKVDSGMTRLGFSPQDVSVIADICRRPCFDAEGIFTHFAEADGKDTDYFVHQQSVFCRVIDELEKRGVHFIHRHCANSAASMRGSCAGMTLSRFGISLYGGWPSEDMRRELCEKICLKPVMQLAARIVQLRTISKGTPIGYGRTYTAEKDTLVAVVTAGYADGVPRLWSNCGFVTVGGARCSILGRVCMDMMMVDASDLPHVKEGDRAVLFGFGGVDADQAAAWAQTISYELFCGVGSRVPRVYINQN